MDNLEFLNTIIQMLTVLFIIYLAMYTLLIRKIPFININNDYVRLKDLIYYLLKFLSSILFAIILTIFTYYSFGTSTIIVSDIKSEVAFLVLLILAAIIVSLWLNVITTGVNFIYKLIIYIQLRKNTISNNLRHALVNKDEHGIIENYKLLIQTDEVINISSRENLILTACLSQYGYNEDVKEMLKPNLYKKQSLLSKSFTTNTVITEYNIQSSDDVFVPSNTMKHKLKHFENITTITSYLMTVVFIIQFVIVTFSEAFHIPNTIMLTFVILTSMFIIALILIKHKKIKNIYRKELASSNLPDDHIKIRKPIIESVLIALTLFMIILAFKQILFY